MRNLERKREYDRERYDKLRKADPEGVRENERIRKANQRAQDRARGEAARGDGPQTISLDSGIGHRVVDQQTYRNWERKQN